MPLIQDFLPIVDDTGPTVSIITPNDDDVFGVNAPNFAISVIDDRLHLMWYALDGGLNNYTFTENGLIDQAAWDTLSDGSVILHFYANDKPGNMGSASVNITKDTQAPVIIINSPKDGDRLGKAPLFDLTIIDLSLKMIWYSFDDGLTNYTIANKTRLDKAPWAALPIGNVTITFYANDAVGNEDFSSVTIYKATPSGIGTVGITIIVASIAGGAGIAVVTYILLKRRRAPYIPDVST
ncbi:MAG: hypothetical protein ACXABO_05840 [Promethearchaeota archaeon]